MILILPQKFVLFMQHGPRSAAQCSGYYEWTSAKLNAVWQHKLAYLGQHNRMCMPAERASGNGSDMPVAQRCHLLHGHAIKTD